MEITEERASPTSVVEDWPSVVVNTIETRVLVLSGKSYGRYIKPVHSAM